MCVCVCGGGGGSTDLLVEILSFSSNMGGWRVLKSLEDFQNVLSKGQVAVLEWNPSTHL